MSQNELLSYIRLAGIVSHAELIASGKSSRQIQAMVQRGDIVRLGRGCYVESALAQQLQRFDDGRRLLAATPTMSTAGRDTVISHESAAQLHGLSLLSKPEPGMSVTRPPGTGSKSAKSAVRLHWARLPASHVSGRFGIPLTTVARTVIDIARTTDFRDGVVVADSALQQRLTSKNELTAVLADCPRWPGIRRATEVVVFADRRAESPLESLARIVFRDCGLPAPELQVEVRDSEFIGRVDFLWKQYRTIVEVDGAAKYQDKGLAMRERRRDKRLREAGYEVVHFDWKEITGDPAYVLKSVLDAFRRGAARARSGSAA